MQVVHETRQPRRELIDRARQRDVAAFTALVEAELAGAWRLVRSIAGTDVEAEDVVQEAFAMAWRDAGITIPRHGCWGFAYASPSTTSTIVENL